MALSEIWILDEIAKQGEPTTMGEEGLLYRVATNNNAYYAKLWYSSMKHKLGNPPEGGRSPHSPYWHRFQETQQALIHMALPDNTVEMSLAFDNRIIRDGAEKPQFSINNPGYPCTVTIEVVGDPELTAIRNEIVTAAYTTMFAYHTRTGRGRTATDAERKKFYEGIEKTDRKIESVLGEELRFVHFDAEMELARRNGLKAPTAILRFLEHGISPIHPQLNFIPTGKFNESGLETEGVFLETHIIDLRRYANAMMGKTSVEKRPELKKRIDEFVLYETLDNIFNIASITRAMNGQVFDAQTGQILFEILEFIRTEETKSPGKIWPYLPQLREAIKNIFRKYSSKNDQMQALQYLKEELKKIE